MLERPTIPSQLDLSPPQPSNEPGQSRRTAAQSSVLTPPATASPLQDFVKLYADVDAYLPFLSSHVSSPPETPTEINGLESNSTSPDRHVISTYTSTSAIANQKLVAGLAAQKRSYAADSSQPASSSRAQPLRAMTSIPMLRKRWSGQLSEDVVSSVAGAGAGVEAETSTSSQTIDPPLEHDVQVNAKSSKNKSDTKVTKRLSTERLEHSKSNKSLHKAKSRSKICSPPTIRDLASIQAFEAQLDQIQREFPDTWPGKIPPQPEKSQLNVVPDKHLLNSQAQSIHGTPPMSFEVPTPLERQAVMNKRHSAPVFHFSPFARSQLAASPRSPKRVTEERHMVSEASGVFESGQGLGIENLAIKDEPDIDRSRRRTQGDMDKLWNLSTWSYDQKTTQSQIQETKEDVQPLEPFKSPKAEQSERERFSVDGKPSPTASPLSTSPVQHTPPMSFPQAWSPEQPEQMVFTALPIAPAIHHPPHPLRRSSSIVTIPAEFKQNGTAQPSLSTPSAPLDASQDSAARLKLIRPIIKIISPSIAARSSFDGDPPIEQRAGRVQRANGAGPDEPTCCACSIQ